MPVHPDVEEDQVGQLVGEEPEGVGAAADRRDAVPLVLQHVAQGRADGRLVVDDQDMLARPRHPPRRAPGASALTRATMCSLATSPSAAPRRRRAPACKYMLARHVILRAARQASTGATGARHRQLDDEAGAARLVVLHPDGAAVLGDDLVDDRAARAPCRRPSWRNRAGRASRGPRRLMPGPLSLTMIRTRPVSARCRVSTRTSPLPPTASTALSTRFRTARLMWSGSTSRSGRSSGAGS